MTEEQANTLDKFATMGYKNIVDTPHPTIPDALLVFMNRKLRRGRLALIVAPNGHYVSAGKEN